LVVDGLDVLGSSMGLADLRGRLAAIPQEPTLFKGTIRSVSQSATGVSCARLPGWLAEG
jgi:ABC-type bacteriocin/lantibiotic exporter with double-glycine peptidase domain